MININNQADCCGCTACASICAHDAITMKPDALGFLYPEVDRSKCVDCGLCEKVCAFNDDYDKSLNIDNPLASSTAPPTLIAKADRYLNTWVLAKTIQISIKRSSFWSRICCYV